MSDMTPYERQQKVKKLRDSGMTYKQIAQDMGVSVERVRQLYLKSTRKDRMNNEVYRFYLSRSNVDIRMNVSDRTINALMRMGVETFEQLKYLDDEEILRARQVGTKAYNEIKWFQRRIRA